MDTHSSLYNEDLAPVPAENRTWTMWNYAALWVGMAVCIPSYMLAASLMKEGMYWWQAVFTIALGNTIVLLPMILNAHAGTKYGIPFPVFLRSSFGVVGANIPAVMRGCVACGWFGIQTWIGGDAIYSLLLVILKNIGVEPFWTIAPLPVLGINSMEFACFLLFWLINMLIIIKGIECIRWLENWSAPLLILIGIGMLAWALNESGGFAVMFSEDTVVKVRGVDVAKEYDFWKVFFPQLTAMVGFWATLALNIPDFTRYARSQRDQMLGQAIGLPATMTFFSFLGIAVTAATVVVFGEAIWDPVMLMRKFESPLVVGFALFALTIATLSTNIAANVVSPANDFSNLAPRRISFRTGGILTGIIGMLIMPWYLVQDLGAYIFTWLIGYGAMLGSIGGVMLCDYYLIRRTRLQIEELYKREGAYSYGGSGINWRAVTALFVGIAPNVPGFLHAATKGGYAASPFFQSLYTYAWFVGLFSAGLAHAVLTLAFPAKAGATAAAPAGAASLEGGL